MPVTTTLHGRAAVITLDRPDRRNAVDRDHADRLVAAVRAADAGDGVDVLVLTGAGGTFCAGADLTALAEPGAPRSNRLVPPGQGDAPMGPSRVRTRKPVLAAVEGHAVAGGLELALWADLRVCASDAVLGVFCRRWGVPLIDGGTVRLPRLVGLGRALDLILTGRPVEAAEALTIGLVDRVVAPGTALTAALELAAGLSALPQECLRNDRAAVLDGLGRPTAEAFTAEWGYGTDSLRYATQGAARFAAGAGRHGTAAPTGDRELDRG